MAVLVEAISAIIRVRTIEESYPGQWPAFVKAVPNQTLCSDNELVRVGFMTPDDCKHFVTGLESLGFTYLSNGDPRDIVVADQMRGFLAKCDWANFGRIELTPGQIVSAAQLKGTTSRRIFCPDGWTYEDSLSQSYGFVPSAETEKSLKFLRHEGGLDVYLNVLTGEEAYIGRTGHWTIH